ncbi:hypothetical protein PR048_030692 [Dryococelus australis]|uniref:C-type lectin domain-containing protein n=1 Tax=Dryococelus australis TaxID=614101 RepID=A0ABQ9G9M2_9NEOP|nr:hypothetical protein PR048_030692 [Dryococelus australis]
MCYSVALLEARWRRCLCVADFENVWIGGWYDEGWSWVSSGEKIPEESDDAGYPPWRYGRSQTRSGCLLLARHVCAKTVFMETDCNRRRGFLCQKGCSLWFLTNDCSL